MSGDCEKFFRNNLACALLYDKDKDMYFGYIGFAAAHPYYGSIFKNVNGEGIYRFNVDFNSESLNGRWWMGFNIQTTYDKAMSKLKKIVDSI
jgi:hypothetical protein